MSQDKSKVFVIPVTVINSEDDTPTCSSTPLASVVKNTATDKSRPKLTAHSSLKSSLKHSFSFRSFFSTLFTLAFALSALALVVLKFLGFHTFTVLSGSMEPQLPVGSLVYVKPTDYRSLRPGDIISYVANADKTIVTHRIVSVESDSADASVLRFRTQGDANSAPDAKLVHYKNVLGTPILTLPYVGYLIHHLQQPPGIYLVLILGTFLLTWTFLPTTLSDHQKSRSKTARKPAPETN